MPSDVSGERPLCFVLMPFGLKTDATGHEVNFDAVYEEAIAPGIRDAGLEPLRADEERDGGFIHKPMFERLLLCPYAIADLTMANANVFYELGIRHSVRPHSTLMIFSPMAQRLPFDVAPLRALPYDLAPTGQPSDAQKLRGLIKQRLEDARDPATDSPLITLLDGYQAPDLSRLKTDVFRDRVRYSEQAKKNLRAARARAHDADAVRAVERSLAQLADLEAGVVVDLLLSYRDVSSWPDMIRIAEQMPIAIARSVLVREQYAFALNRAQRPTEAITVLQKVIEQVGPSSETYGLLGRVCKDLWSISCRDGDVVKAAGHLNRAIEAYRAGFEHDWRDAYPGVNLVSLLHIRDRDDPELAAVLPVVAYASRRRIATNPDYWDHATAIELAYIRQDRNAALSAAAAAISADDVHDWQKQSTANNLQLHLLYGLPSDKDRQLIDDLTQALVPKPRPMVGFVE